MCYVHATPWVNSHFQDIKEKAEILNLNGLTNKTKKRCIDRCLKKKKKTFPFSFYFWKLTSLIKNKSQKKVFKKKMRENVTCDCVEARDEDVPGRRHTKNELLFLSKNNNDNNDNKEKNVKSRQWTCVLLPSTYLCMMAVVKRWEAIDQIWQWRLCNLLISHFTSSSSLSPSLRLSISLLTVSQALLSATLSTLYHCYFCQCIL